MPHYKTFTNQEFIGAYALPKGEDLTVTIKSARKQEVTSTGGRKQDCFVITLEGPYKPMILNSTNQRSIVKLYGTETDNWAGKSFTLYASTTQMAGETVECLRIRPTVGAPKKRSISDERLIIAVTAVEEGKFTVSTLLEKYELTEAQLARLPKQIDGETNG
jgi:hypothetical protein